MKIRRKNLFVSLTCLLALIGLVGSAFATNLVTNGGFESGNTGFDSDYTYVDHMGDQALWDEGTYAVGANPHAYHTSWASFAAYEGGNMMIVNGNTSQGVNVWKQEGITVLKDTTYYFSAYAASCYATSPAVLNFSINGGSIGTITLTDDIGEWKLFYAIWNSGDNTTANVLALVNQNTEYSGNDFCLDNISMDTLNPVPVPPAVLLLGSGLVGLVGLRWRRARKES